MNLIFIQTHVYKGVSYDHIPSLYSSTDAA